LDNLVIWSANLLDYQITELPTKYLPPDVR